MKKSVKGILGLSAALAVLGGGYAALMLTKPQVQPEDSGTEITQEENQNILLINDDKTEDGVISKVDVKNQTDELHVIINNPKTEDSAATYTLDGYQDIALNTAVVGTLANNANNLTSESLIEENPENLEKFGLETPQITVRVTYESGTKKTLYIGNKAPSGNGYYVMADDIDAVFTASNSKLANYSKTLFDFVRTTVLEEPDQSDYPIVSSLKIEREDIDYDILLKYDGKSDDEDYNGGTSATHVMVEPTDAYLAVERSTDITNGMLGLSAKEIYCVHCKESDIAEAGLKEPFCRVTMTTKEHGEYVLLLSEPFTDDDNDKCCYAMLEDGNTIYTVKAEDAKWVTVMPIDIASRIFIGSYVWNVTDLSIECNTGDKADFVITPVNPDADVSSPTSEDFAATLNGSEFDTERYRQFYSFLISADAEDFALDEKIPDSEPMAMLSYTDSYTHETTEIGFYDYSNLTALVTINGKSKFFMTKAYVDTLIKNVQLLDTDEDFITTWK